MWEDGQHQRSVEHRENRQTDWNRELRDLDPEKASGPGIISGLALILLSPYCQISDDSDTGALWTGPILGFVKGSCSTPVRLCAS